MTVAFVDPVNRDSLEAAEKIFGSVTQLLCSKSDFSVVLRALENEAVLLKADQLDEKSVVGMVNAILEEASSCGASDIHIEPMRDRLRVRFRLDGVLVPFKDLPLPMGPPISRVWTPAS